eukprot:s148_g32.t1
MDNESTETLTPKHSRSEESAGDDEAANAEAPPPRRTGKRPAVPVMDADSNVSPTVNRGRKRQSLAAGTPPAPLSMPEASEDDGCKEKEMKRLQQELNEQKSLAVRRGQLLSQSLVELAKVDREKIRTKLYHDQLRLGKYKNSSMVFGQTDTWEGGSEAEMIEQQKVKLREERESVELTRRSLPRQTKKAEKEDDEKDLRAQGSTFHPASFARGTPLMQDGKDKEANPEEDDTMETREVCAHRLEYIKREDLAIKDSLEERENRLVADRMLHLKQKSLVNSEDRSRFRHYQQLQGGRYQLLNMSLGDANIAVIGRGGFSEIYKAFDLDQSLGYCAPVRMSEAQRVDLVRWALRECEIQKKLQHPRIVELRDCFPLDSHAYVLVLELCEGETLDHRLKMSGPMLEKEAKTIIVQILSGLRYLNVCGRRIIHYDIKPSNIFYHAGQVKIGDFGLSKTMAADMHPEAVIDLSTRGAGTSWYLPPDPCWELAEVDVWSTGIVFFELLFNRRPFGEGKSQDAFRREAADGTFDLVIPTAPRVSNEAKELLKKLLTRDREQRPDVIEALQDPYIRPQKNSGLPGLRFLMLLLVLVECSLLIVGFTRLVPGAELQ